jgi:hypothetical protein
VAFFVSAEKVLSQQRPATLVCSAPDQLRPRWLTARSLRDGRYGHRRRSVTGVDICNYFFPQGLVTWLDTAILSRTIQEVIDARQLV